MDADDPVARGMGRARPDPLAQGDGLVQGAVPGRSGAAADPHVSPLRGDLRGLPPAVLVVGTLDPLLSDSELFAAALERAGVPAELHVFEDGPHAFAQIFALDMARDAVGRISAFARARLA